MTLQKKLLIYSGRPANCSNKINIPKINFFFNANAKQTRDYANVVNWAKWKTNYHWNRLTASWFSG